MREELFRIHSHTIHVRAVYTLRSVSVIGRARIRVGKNRIRVLQRLESLGRCRIVGVLGRSA